MATETRSLTELARHVFDDVLNRRDADALLEFWAEDVVEVFPTGTLRGRQAVRDYFAQTFAAMPDFHIEATHIAEAGENVFVKWHITGTFSGGPWNGIEPTGSWLEMDGMDCFTVRDGLVVHNFVVFDQMSFARQIGMMPPENSAGDRALRGAFNAKTRLRDRLRNR